MKSQRLIVSGGRFQEPYKRLERVEVRRTSMIREHEDHEDQMKGDETGSLEFKDCEPGRGGGF